MADIAKVEHKVMGFNDNKTGEQSNGLKVEVAIFILLIIGAIVIIGFWLGGGWPDELQKNFSNLLTVEAVKEYLDYKERLRAARLQFLTSIAAILGGIGVVFNLYYTGKREEAFNKSAIAANKSAAAALENAKAALKNAEAAQDKQLTDRFTKAVEQLASPEIAVRLGGIYALERIAKDSEKDHWTIMEVLTAFVREPPPLKAPLEEEKLLLELPTHIQKAKDVKQPQKLRIDIQAALTVIGRRDTEKDPENQKLDLSNANIAAANLTEANLEKAHLFAANLQEAKLFKANLEKAYLRQAKLQEAVLCKARLHEADLTEANLEKAHLMQAELPGTDLNGAKLKSANLGGANLHQTILFKANLENANLRQAKLQEAVFRKANLQGVDFSDANLEEANLSKANLEGANLSEAKNLKQEQIEEAFGNKNTTRLPENLKAPEHWTKSK
jgi:uncharacterized protein YjbI with pentapeptide repeats